MKAPVFTTCPSTTPCVLVLMAILTVVGGNSVASDCVTGLQTTCAEEMTSLEKQRGTEACSYLSKAISCVACKMPNCTDIAANIVQTYGEPPYSCPLQSDDVILLQQGDKSVELCLLLKPTTTGPPGKEPQVQDGYDGRSGASSLAVYYLPFLALLMTLPSR